MNQSDQKSTDSSKILPAFRGLWSRFVLGSVRIRLRLSGLRLYIPELPHLPRPSRIQAAAVCFTVLFALPAAAVLRPGMRVTFDGRTIGYVANAEEASQAADAFEQSVSTFTGKAYDLDGKITLTPTLALPSQFDTEKETVSALAEAEDGVDMLAVLTVDGKTVGACATADEVQQALDAELDRYKTSADDDARFLEDVNVSLTPAPSDAMISAEDLQGKLEAGHTLSVEVTSTQSYTEAIPHETLWVENDQMDQNTTQVILNGSDGEAKVEAEVVSVNGVETTRTIVSRAVLSRATNAVIAVGTRNIGIGTGELMVPLTSYRYTSGFKYRGDHWHKGVDLAAEVGSPVYAADNGKVIVSEWSDSYGNYIILDHGNGLKTLYAHNSALLVGIGDVVAKGTQIALSGNTGNSTGPHVHFEVHINGVAVNPELYLTLGALSE